MSAPFGPVFPAAGYLLGSVSTGLLLARRRGVDLREVGSGNTGATNVGRALGRSAGKLVLVVDVLKGFGPTMAARRIMGRENPWTAATGFAAAFGHCFPLWHGFQGGKGAATAVGALLALNAPAGAMAGLTYGLLRKATGRASVGSLGGAIVGAAWLLATKPARPPSVMGVALLALLIARHRDNLVRLIEGTEPAS